LGSVLRSGGVTAVVRHRDEMYDAIYAGFLILFLAYAFMAVFV